MKNIKSLLSILFIAGTLASNAAPVSAAEGIISKIPDASGKYCSMKFPAIREETLNWDRPVLKDRSEGDIIDFFGPCDYDPLGKEEVERQKAHRRRMESND